jgi:hypothetical protein
MKIFMPLLEIASELLGLKHGEYLAKIFNFGLGVGGRVKFWAHHLHKI